MNVNTFTVSQTVLYSRHVTCHRHLAYIRPTTTAFSFVELAFYLALLKVRHSSKALSKTNLWDSCSRFLKPFL